MSWLHLYVILVCSVIGHSHNQTDVQTKSQNQSDIQTKSQYQTDAPTNINELESEIEPTTAGKSNVGISKSLEGIEIAAVPVTEFDEFCVAIKDKLQVTDDMLRLPDVREWFEENFTSKHKRFDPENPIYIARATAELASVWCSYCQSVNNCPCIRRFCFNVTC